MTYQTCSQFGLGLFIPTLETFAGFEAEFAAADQFIEQRVCSCIPIELGNYGSVDVAREVESHEVRILKRSEDG